MTYTFKLSRRLALIKVAALVAAVQLTVSCNADDNFSADPRDESNPTSFVILPDSTIVEVKGTVQFSSAGGDYSTLLKGKRWGQDRKVIGLEISPGSSTVVPGDSRIFNATATLSDGSTVEPALAWSATGGSIDKSGKYTAGKVAGNYGVTGTASNGMTDTALVTVSAVAQLVLSPASVAIPAGGSQQFAVQFTLTDTATVAGTATFSASGGTITPTGLYTAGEIGGTFRVIATASGGELVDTAVVTISAPSPAPPADTTPAPAPPPQTSPPAPPPPSGTTFFQASGEGGNYAWSLPSPGWGAQFNGTHSLSQTQVKNGSWAYKYEVTSSGVGTIAHDVRTMSGQPQGSMGSLNGRYRGGYYSWWMYVDAGYTTPAETTAWNLLMGWMTGVSGTPTPICNLGLEVRSGVLQLVFVLKNASSAGGTPLYSPPTLPGMTRLGDAWYKPTATVPFPRNRWVHVTAYTNFARSNGVFKVWQDGVLIMDLTHPTMNLFDGWTNSGVSGTNTAGDMMIQFGNYGGHQDGVQRFYMDDFKVTDYQVVP